MWTSDGTASGTRVLLSGNGFYDGAHDYIDLTSSGDGRVYLWDEDDTSLADTLYTTDGTTAGTAALPTSAVVPVAAGPLAALGGQAVFLGTTGSGATEGLYITDGTAGGTHLLKSLGATSTVGSTSFETGTDQLEFVVGDYGTVYQTDGTAAGTTDRRRHRRAGRHARRDARLGRRQPVPDHAGTPTPTRMRTAASTAARAN